MCDNIKGIEMETAFFSWKTPIEMELLTHKMCHDFVVCGALLWFFFSLKKVTKSQLPPIT